VTSSISILSGSHELAINTNTRVSSSASTVQKVHEDDVNDSEDVLHLGLQNFCTVSSKFWPCGLDQIFIINSTD
jgi:hypothetical protein